jgi:hypothetical protein
MCDLGTKNIRRVDLLLRALLLSSVRNSVISRLCSP